MLLLGYGAIGRHLAPMLQGLGMRLTALRHRPDAAVCATLRAIAAGEARHVVNVDAGY